MVNSPEPQNIKVGRGARLAKSTKQIVSAFFQRPLFYIYYTALFGMVLSLLLGRTLSVPFYLIMLALTIIMSYEWAQKKQKKNTLVYGRRRSQRSTQDVA